MKNYGMLLSSIFLGGRSLKDLNFPKKWKYEPDMFRYKNNKESILWEQLLPDNKKSRKIKKYLYITDKMLCDINYNLIK
jgi:hypothetical protein